MPQVIQLRGAKLLKVVSIIMIIFGALSTAGGFISIGSGSLMSSVLGLDEYGLKIISMLGIVSVISGIVMLVFGILGVKNCNRPDRIGFMLLIGIILIMEAIFSSIYSYALAPAQEYVARQVLDATLQSYGVEQANSSLGVVATNPVMMWIGVALPALFFIGALLNKLPPKVVASPAYPPVYDSNEYEDAYMQQMDEAGLQQPQDEEAPLQPQDVLPEEEAGAQDALATAEEEDITEPKEQ